MLEKRNGELMNMIETGNMMGNGSVGFNLIEHQKIIPQIPIYVSQVSGMQNIQNQINGSMNNNSNQMSTSMINYMPNNPISCQSPYNPNKNSQQQNSRLVSKSCNSKTPSNYLVSTPKNNLMINNNNEISQNNMLQNNQHPVIYDF
jgi:hypothetical protein